MADNQAPTRDDYLRAATFYRHRLGSNVEGINTILAEASELDRTSALILAVANIGIMAPGSALGKPDEAFDGLSNVIIDMAAKLSDPDPEEGGVSPS